MKRLHLAFLALLLFSSFACNPSETEADMGPTYKEQYRPQLHFTPPTQWMNDPNGMVYYEGEYHLFYQHYPDSNVWGPMHWGHAISTDLVHWEQLPIALYPDSLGYIFSGSAIVDWTNDSGFGENDLPPLLAFYTYHDPKKEKAGEIDTQSQGLAYSNDKGRSWTKYEGNPIIPNPGLKDFRDPKVIWDADSEQWVMVFAVGDHIAFYGSTNLKDWTHLSDFGRNWGAHGGVWECPDLFPMNVGDSGDKDWVLLVSINPGGPNGGSATQYFIGDFDGRRFRLDPEFEPQIIDSAMWLDYGRDNYAGVTWSDVQDGRRIFMGWMSNWDYAQIVPTEVWRSAMTLPRELSLQNTAEGPRLFSRFPDEVLALRGDAIAHQIDGQVDQSIEIDADPGMLDISLRAAISPDGGNIFGFELSNEAGERYRIGFDQAGNTYFSDRRQSGKVDFSDAFAKDVHYAPRTYEGTIVTMRIILDVASVELVADDGASVLTDIFFPTEDFSKIQFFVESGSVEIQQLEVYPMRSIW